MTTTGIGSWAVDLANIGPVYPFQGLEIIMLLIGLAFWIWWHIWSIKRELATYDEKIQRFGSKEQIVQAIESD